MIPTTNAIGERILLSHCKTEKFKAGTLSVSLVLPIKPETTYLTSLLLSVLTRGCQSYPDIASLNRRLDYLYGTELSVRNCYRGDAQVVGLTANILADRYLPSGEALIDAVLLLMSEILFCPVTDADGLLHAHYVESEKTLQCDTIRSQKNHPRAYAAELAGRLLYRNDPAGTPLYGSVQEVTAVTRERLTAHWKALLSDLSLHVFYVGSSETATLRAALERHFAPHLPVGSPTPLPVAVSPVHTTDATPLRAEETLAINQGQLVLGFRTGCTLQDKDFYVCSLLNEVLGASPVSKLFVNVREKLSLCYSCSSSYNGYKGTLTVKCGLLSGNRARAEEEILCQLAAIAHGEVSDAEWEAAHRSLINSYRQLSDSPVAIESYYFGRSLSKLDTPMEEAIRAICAVERAEVIAMASRLLLDTVFFLRESGGGEEEIDEEN